LLGSSTPATDRLLGGVVEVYLGETEARQALTEILRDEPEWVEILRVERVATVDVAPN
jgi:hypothetical protein